MKEIVEILRKHIKISQLGNLRGVIRLIPEPDIKEIAIEIESICYPPEVKWEAIASDDFIFRYTDYILRVEQMDKKYWWWAVYKNHEEIAFDEPRAKTELEAKLLAELHFIKYRFENIKNK